MRVTRPGRARSLSWPLAGVILALLSGYGMLALIAGLAVFGIAVSVNETVWSWVIVGCSAMAVLGLGRRSLQHRRAGPLIFGTAGFLAIAWAMLGIYSRAGEIAGFAALLAAALLDRRMCRRSATGRGPLA